MIAPESLSGGRLRDCGDARQVPEARAGPRPAVLGHSLPSSSPCGDERGTGLCAGSLLGAQALRQTSPGGVLLADAGFDSVQVFREAQGKFLLMIRLKGDGVVKDGHRKKARKVFREEIYRLHAVGEEPFWALKNPIEQAVAESATPTNAKGGFIPCSVLCAAGLPRLFTCASWS